jgi:hypothetical protein
MEAFRGEPAPPDMATFKKLAEYWTGAIANQLSDAPDDVKARFAELFDLHVTIHPDRSQNGYHFDLTANIPLEMEGDKPGAFDMVFSPSRKGGRAPRNDRIKFPDSFYSTMLYSIINVAILPIRADMLKEDSNGLTFIGCKDTRPHDHHLRTLRHHDSG